jgi:hypothetical protein
MVTNHDNFSQEKYLFPLLPCQLKQVYKDLYNYNYIKTLKDNVSEQKYKQIEELCSKPEESTYMKEKDISLFLTKLLRF